MVTYRQFGRGVMQTMRAIDRDAKRAQRFRMAQEKEAQRQGMLEAAADAVEEYEDIIEQLTGSHRVCLTRKNWLEVANLSPEPIPNRTSIHEDEAKQSLANYQPGWFARTFGFAEWQRKRLMAARDAAKALDTKKHAELVHKAKTYNVAIDTALSVIALDPAAVSTALDKHSELGDLPFTLEGIDILFKDGGRVVALVDALEIDDMPTKSITLLQSGKASVKPLSKGKITEIYFENICSGAIRVAVEFLKVLPLDKVEVVMHADILDTSSGHIHEMPLLYVLVTAQALEQINLSRTDASALIDRLGGRYNWNKKNGFIPLDISELGLEIELSD